MKVLNIIQNILAMFIVVNMMIVAPFFGIVFIFTLALLCFYGLKMQNDLHEALFGLRQGWFESEKAYLDRIWAISGLERPEDKKQYPWGTKAPKKEPNKENTDS